MSRWDRYVGRLDEKVSKQEIDDALKNPDILVGAEFEFIVTDGLDVGDNQEAIQLYNSAYNDVDEYNNNVRNYEQELDEYERETTRLEQEKEALDEKKSELEDAISEAESSRDDFKVEVSTEVTTIKGLEKNKVADPNTVKSEIATAKANMNAFVQKMNKENKNIAEWTKEIEKLDSKISDLEDEIKDREENRYENVESPYFNEHNYPDYFDYMTNWVGSSKRDLYVEPGEKADYPVEWEENAGGSDDFEGAVEKSGILNSAPFSSYELGAYGTFSPKPGDTKWAVESDSSLGEDGVEVKNPPMPLPEFSNKTLKKMFDWINKVGYTDSSCGFHAHMSLKNPAHELDYVKLVLFTDEGFIYKTFSDRAGSFYAMSAKEKIKTQGILSSSDVHMLFNKKDLVMKTQLKSEHYDAINVIDTKTGHVEFRYMGGGYSKKYDEVRAIIGVYAHNLSLAMDPNYKRKEYITKIQRIMNKMELYVLDKKEDVLRYVITFKDLTGADTKVLLKMSKDIDDRKRHLSMYKLDPDTIKGLNGNKEFMGSMKLTILNELYKVLSKPAWEYVSKVHMPEL